MRFSQRITRILWFSFFITWEQRKLGDVVSRFATGLNPRDNFTLNSGGKNYYVTIKNFTHGNLVLDDNCDKIDDEALALIQARSDLRIGDILFSSIGRVGDCFLIENRPINWNINESVFVLRPVKDAVDPLYLMHTIHSERVLSVILSCVTGSTFKSIKMAQLKETNIPYPNIVEQKQIGKFITAIDNLITLHQRKQNWQNLRFLRKISSLILAIAWEQRKLGEVAQSFEYGLNVAAKEYDGINKYLRITDIDDVSRKFDTDNLTSPDTELAAVENYRLVDGDILFARTGASVGKSYIYRVSDGLVYFAGFLIRAKIKPEYDAEFVFQNTLSESYEKYVQITSQRSGQPGVNAQEYSDYVFYLPTYDEQQKIGAFLRNLDNLITLHQCKRAAFMSRKSHSIFQFEEWKNTLTWEQRKFEDAFIERREKTVTENEDTLLSCAINGMFLNSELFGHFRGTTTIGYLKVKKNDLILSAQNLHLGNANVNLRFEHGIISPAYKVYDLNNCEPEFVQAWVKKEDTKNFFLAATTEGASQCRKNIEWDTLGKQTICMPAIKEQATIGSFFKCVDNLITLHQRGENIYNRRQTW